MLTHIGKVKVKAIGPHLLELTPPWYRGVYCCIDALPELQKIYLVLTVFAVGSRLYVLTHD